jgi:hypothetical protein
MKLRRLRPKPASETAEPTYEPPEPTFANPPATLAFQVLAYSKSGLPNEEFSAQTETLRRILSYDGDTRGWYAWLSLDHPERAAEVPTSLFEAARLYGTTVRVQAQSTAQSRPGQAP